MDHQVKIIDYRLKSLSLAYLSFGKRNVLLFVNQVALGILKEKLRILKSVDNFHPAVLMD